MFGSPRRHFPVCASTQTLARDWARDPDDPAPHGALVTADFQSAGRGRRGRFWEARSGEAALMSFVLRPAFPSTRFRFLGFAAALAVADALSPFGLAARLKWPNDVLLDGKKAAGLLVEASPKFVIVGIGVNVNQTEFTGAFLTPPTSLKRELGRSVPVDDVVTAVADALEKRQQDNWTAISDGWRTRLAVGATVRRGNENGALVGLNDDGSARVRLAGAGTFADWASVEAQGEAD